MRIFTIGETVYDIIFKNNQPIAAKAGGSALNTSVSLGRLGLEVSFISDLGKDIIGNNIIAFLNENGVSTGLIEQYPNRKTSIAIAFLDDNNDASYTFYKDFPDRRLEWITPEFEEGDIVMFGSFFAISAQLRPKLKEILIKAREEGCLIIYDPNFRKAHLHELGKLKPFIIENIALSDLVRGSDEDFHHIFGANSPAEAFERVMDNGCRNLLYTANRNDVSMMNQNHTSTGIVPVIQTISTIGAGDNFNAGLIWTLAQQEVCKKDLEHLHPKIMDRIIANGILFASEVCMSYENYISEAFAAELRNKTDA